MLSDGRISLRLRTEVSDISSQGAIRVNGLEVPATTTRMAETTVEMGSGQSMMIAGLLNNQLSSSVDKMPGVGRHTCARCSVQIEWLAAQRNRVDDCHHAVSREARFGQPDRITYRWLNSIDDAQRIIMGKVTDKTNDMNRPMPPSHPQPRPDLKWVRSAMRLRQFRNKGEKATAQAAVSGPGFSFDN